MRISVTGPAYPRVPAALPAPVIGSPVPPLQSITLPPNHFDRPARMAINPFPGMRW